MGWINEESAGKILNNKYYGNNKRKRERKYKKGMLYNTKKWRRFSKWYRKKYPFCKKCDKLASDVDHIIPIKEGGDPYNLKNLQALCKTCHAKKTKEDKNSF